MNQGADKSTTSQISPKKILGIFPTRRGRLELKKQSQEKQSQEKISQEKLAPKLPQPITKEAKVEPDKNKIITNAKSKNTHSEELIKPETNKWPIQQSIAQIPKQTQGLLNQIFNSIRQKLIETWSKQPEILKPKLENKTKPEAFEPPNKSAPTSTNPEDALDSQKIGALDGQKIGALDGQKIGVLDSQQIGALSSQKIGALALLRQVPDKYWELRDYGNLKKIPKFVDYIALALLINHATRGIFTKFFQWIGKSIANFLNRNHGDYEISDGMHIKFSEHDSSKTLDVDTKTKIAVSHSLSTFSLIDCRLNSAILSECFRKREGKKKAVIEYLSLNHNNMDAKDIRYLFGNGDLWLYSKIKWQLKLLSLSDNFFGNNGVPHIASLLKNSNEIHNTLLCLNLDNNGFDSKHMRILCDGIKKCEKLEILDISNNPIGDKGARFLADAIKGNKNIKCVRAAGCWISKEGAKFIFDALQGHESMFYIDLSHNPIPNAPGNLSQLNCLVNLQYTFIPSSMYKTGKILCGSINGLYQELKSLNLIDKLAKLNCMSIKNKIADHSIAYIPLKILFKLVFDHSYYSSSKWTDQNFIDLLDCKKETPKAPWKLKYYDTKKQTLHDYYDKLTAQIDSKDCECKNKVINADISDFSPG